MLKKPWKIIENKNGNTKIYGNNHWKEIRYKAPDWSDTNEPEPYFTYKDYDYFLSEIISIHRGNYPDWMKEFDGIMSESYFSGILVKISNCGDSVKVYTYF